MASVEAEMAGTAPSRKRFLHGKSTLAGLASDGVSCTVCHQIPSDDLGTDESFSGHFRIGDEGKIFGPHARPFFMPMYRHTGYRATESSHVRESALCAACHTLFAGLALRPDAAFVLQASLGESVRLSEELGAAVNSASDPTWPHLYGVFADDVFTPEVLEAVERVTRAAGHAPYAHRVLSLATLELDVELSPDDTASLREWVLTNSLMSGNLVSID